MSCRAPWSVSGHRPLLGSSALRIRHPLILRTAHHAASVPRKRNTVINPPATTRPPPLALPNRSSYVDSTLKYYFHIGKAYITFYKDGLKAVLTNRRLLKEKLERTPEDDRPSVFKPHYVPKSFSRADWVLLWRVRHDMIRLPFFGLMLIVLGEFTVLVVALVGSVVPYTCRIPRQVYGALESSEQRRKLAFQDLERHYPDGALSLTKHHARAHVLRSLNISVKLWDHLGVTSPTGWFLRGKLRMAFLEGDDKNLVEDGGLVDLQVEELRIACAERGIDVLGKSEDEMRSKLGDWLRLTAAKDDGERRQRMARLLLTR